MIAKYDSRAFVLRKQAYRVDTDVSELRSGEEGEKKNDDFPLPTLSVPSGDHRSPASLSFLLLRPSRVNKQPTQGAAHATARTFQHTPVRRRAVLTD